METGGPAAPWSVSLSSCCSLWRDCEQGTVSGTEGLLGSSEVSVGGGEGESLPRSETGGSAAPSLLRLWTFLLSSLRSTLSARRSFSSRWTFPCRASNSRSCTDFWTGRRHRRVQLSSFLAGADISQRHVKRTSSDISRRALLLLSHRDRYMAVSFSSFLIFLVIWVKTKASHGAQITQSPRPPSTHPHLLHLLFKGGEHLVALGQRHLKLFKLLGVQ